MANYKLSLIVLGFILIGVGIVLFNLLRFWGIIALIVGLIALARAFTMKSVENEKKKKEPKEEVVESETEEESEEEKKKIEVYDVEEEEPDEEEAEKIEEEDVEEEK